MVDEVSEDRVRELRYLHRVKFAALINRESSINCIKSMYELFERVESDPNLVPGFLLAVGDLEYLWETFW